MFEDLRTAAAGAHRDDLARRALGQRRATAARTRGRRALGTIVIREAAGADEARLMRLLALDSRPITRTRWLLGEVDGDLAAAMPLDGHPVAADPFRPTRELEALLELRATQLRSQGPLIAPS